MKDTLSTTDRHPYPLGELLSDLKSDLSLKTRSYKLALFYLVFSPSIRVLFCYRISRFLYVHGRKRFAYIFKSLQSRYGCYLSFKGSIGKRLYLPHPAGIVIGDGVVIEDDVSIWQNVTLGSHGKPRARQEYPYICSGVKIFAGAVLLGNIKVGENAIVGANAVVLSDVPANTVAVGVPYKGNL
ncbi:hypothetical protein PN498_10590 [Oscillatoria sp. CS-180]|uniref:serine O-acetyltransferase n=1 Tax=Oscillatoria sp. CS-180 TaxID=3021720 RepID=UPI00232F8514|nr:hypothetical protein [Oscillatoria sp. CS-180]MDB9526436.1 hypothetical protein [Oscillatoria sp. CS-180]